MNLNPFKLSDDELLTLNSDYSLIIKNVDFTSINKNQYNEIPENYGVYFWLMRYKNDSYKIYIGKTNSLKRRVNDYTIDFQIHSPNDFKLQFFQNFIRSNLDGTNLDLHFMQCTKDDYTEKETKAINMFKPFINQRAKVSVEVKNKMKKAFEGYYHQIFADKLST